jgi:integrase/recombinase XerD
VLKYCGSNVVDRCLIQYPLLKPKKHYERLAPLDTQVYRDLLKAWETADQNSFHVVRMYAMVALYMGTGARNKELRLADETHLDLDARTLYIAHPKGEGSWGHPRLTLVMPEVIPIAKRYLELRRAWLLNHNADTKCLFFSLDGKEYGYLSDNSTRVLKSHMEDLLHAKFEYRDCRRWFAQSLIDMGLPIYEVSVLLGHASTTTTEMAYGRNKLEQALKNAKELTDRMRPSEIGGIESEC